MLVALIAGVVVHFYTSLSLPSFWLWSSSVVLLIASIPIISVHQKTTALFGVSLIFTFFLLGLHLSRINTSTTHDLYFEKIALKNENVFDAQILEPPQEKVNSVKCVIRVFAVNGEESMGKALVYLEKDSLSMNLKYGQIISFKSSFNPISKNGNPHEFDYQRYLEIHDIHCQAYVQSDNWILTGENGNKIVSSVYELRDYLTLQLKESGLSDKNFMVANALLLGQKDFLDKDVLRSYSSAGAMHVLAVSGLHVGIIMLILSFFLSGLKQLKKGRMVYLVCILSGIWFYALITGLSPSVLRASVMFSFIIVGKELQRDTSIYQSIMVSAFLLIILEPYIIFQVGFQLSYLAVLGIVYLQPKIVNLFFVKNYFLDKAWQITAVSIAAQIATFPLGLYYFHQFPNFFMLSNLIVIPAAFLLLILGVSFFVLHLVPLISEVILYLFDAALSLLNWAVEFVQSLPYSIVWGISIHWFEVIILYLIIFLGAVSFDLKRVYLLMTSLVLTCILLVFNVYEKAAIQSTDRAYIYNIKDEIAIDIFQGSENIFYCSKALKRDDEKLLFHVKHNWFYRSGREEPAEWVDVDNDNLLIMGGQSLLILNDSIFQSVKEIPLTDYVYLYNCSFVPESVIEGGIDSKAQFILGYGLSYGVKSFLKSKLPENSIHDLKTEGAFEIDLNH